MTFDAFAYDGKRVLVVGGATGMGAAAAQTAKSRGAEVVVMDVQDVSFPIDEFIRVDLRDRSSVDDAMAQVAGPIDALFSCAGVADGTPGIEYINFIAHRHMIESLAAVGKLGQGSSVALISSTAGIGWRNRIDQLLEFLATPDWEAAGSWIDAHPGTASYTFAKQAVNTYVAREAHRLLRHGIRINAILPGPTDTPLGLANAELWLAVGQDYRESVGADVMHAEQMGNALVFLCSAAASGISGETLTVDLGQVASAQSGSYPDAIVDLLMTM